MNNNRVLLAMSGGIDSTVAAVLLQNQGYEVVGITFILWKYKKDGIFPIHQLDRVKKLADILKMKHHSVSLEDKFKKGVIDYFTDEYLNARTPFPCIVCNNTIKWATLYKYALELNCAYIATGHYAKKFSIEGYYHIMEGDDKNKDQSFFLWGLSQEILKKAIFPMGSLTKEKVKEIAFENKFGFLKKEKESTGPCFIKGNDYRLFLKQVIKQKEITIERGEFIDCLGNSIGNHQGYPFYTIGQRRKLGIYLNKALFVKKIDKDTNQVVLSDKKQLFKNEFLIENYRFFNQKIDFSNQRFTVKIRYRKQENLCNLVFSENNRLKVCLLQPLDSISPGQTAVFYKNNIVYGGGFIC